VLQLGEHHAVESSRTAAAGLVGRIGRGRLGQRLRGSMEISVCHAGSFPGPAPAREPARETPRGNPGSEVHAALAE
jgi:hypothetical protein